MAQIMRNFGKLLMWTSIDVMSCFINIDESNSISTWQFDIALIYAIVDCFRRFSYSVARRKPIVMDSECKKLQVWRSPVFTARPSADLMYANYRGFICTRAHYHCNVSVNGCEIEHQEESRESLEATNNSNLFGELCNLAIFLRNTLWSILMFYNNFTTLQLFLFNWGKEREKIKNKIALYYLFI